MFPTNAQARRRRAELATKRGVLGCDAGASTVEVLGWATMSTVAIVAIGAALQVLGVDLINYVRVQLGL